MKRKCTLAIALTLLACLVGVSTPRVAPAAPEPVFTARVSGHDVARLEESKGRAVKHLNQVHIASYSIDGGYIEIEIQKAAPRGSQDCVVTLSCSWKDVGTGEEHRGGVFGTVRFDAKDKPGTKRRIYTLFGTTALADHMDLLPGNPDVDVLP